MTTRRICKRSLISIIFNDIISTIDSLDNVQRPRPITGINHGQGGFLPKNHPLGIRQDGNTLNKWPKHTEEKVNSIAIRPTNIQTSQPRWIQILPEKVQLTTSKSYSNTPPEGTGIHRGRCLNHRLILGSTAAGVKLLQWCPNNDQIRGSHLWSIYSYFWSTTMV